MSPWAFSQAKSNPPFPRENSNVGFGDSPLLASLPTSTWFEIFRPHLWGYHLFGPERGLAWFSLGRALAVLLGFYLTLWLLTRGNCSLSAIGSLWLFYSTFVQWWFSNVLGDCLSLSLLCFPAFCAILRCKQKSSIALATLVFTLLAVGFAITLYPAFQIPLAYVLGGAAITYVMIEQDRERLWLHWKFKAACIVVSLLICGACIGAFIFDTLPTIKTIMATAYPGARFMTGGGGTVLRLVSGIADPLSVETRFPLQWGNVCEATSFLLLWPVVLIQLLVGKPRSDSLLRAVVPSILVVVAFSVWYLFEMPEIIAKLSLLSQVPANRSLLAIGIASILACILTIRFGNALELKKWWIWGPVTLAIACCAAVATLKYSIILPVPLSRLEIVRQVSFVTVASLGILVARPLLLAFGLLGATIVPNFLINPISSGAAPLLRAPIVESTRPLFERDPAAKWIVFGPVATSQLLASGGYFLLSGTRYLPNLEMWSKFDPERRSVATYNRYAHVEFAPLEPGTEPARFELVVADWIRVHVDPCSETLADLGVRYFIFTSRAELRKYGCIEPIRLPELPRGYAVGKRRG